MGEYGVHLSATYLGYISRLYISGTSLSQVLHSAMAMPRVTYDDAMRQT